MSFIWSSVKPFLSFQKAIRLQNKIGKETPRKAFRISYLEQNVLFYLVFVFFNISGAMRNLPTERQAELERKHI